MATLSDSLVSSSARKLPVRMRPDLSARRQQYLGRSYWVVKEPVGLNYFRFQDEEYAILQMLDGQTSLDEIKERFEEEFPPQKITVEELQQFLGMLHRSGLIIAGAAGQGHELRKRRDERRRKELLAACSNILCVRFKGFDPERWLNWLYPKVRFLFTPTVLVLCLMLWTVAATLVLVEWDVFHSKLPGFYQFFNVYNALLLAVTLGLTKILHEFGHGLMCKHFGGECHEMGIMILVLTPCLYCNVSDSWMLPSKWQRAFIGAAGIFVEVTLASIATFLWWFSEPGLFHNLCLNVMFVASVTTIFFNANPLLRYDGYYILADLVEIPNLRQKSTTILSRKLGELCLGLESPEDPFLPQRNQIFFALYTVAAVMYRWFILASIMYFLFQFFKPYRLEIIGQAIVAMSLYGLIVMPIYKVGKFFYVPGRLDKVKKPRMYTSLGVLTAVVLAFIFVPLPHSVLGVLEVQPRDAVPVYVDVAQGGRLDEVYVRPGDRVVAGQPLAQLENLEIDRELVRLRGKEQQLVVEIANATRVAHNIRLRSSELPALRESLETIRQQIDEREADRTRLRLVAPVGGIVLPPDAIPSQPEAEGQLRTWSGTPFDPENLGCHLPEAVLFCQIGDPQQLEAMVAIDQTDLEFVNRLLHEAVRPKVEIKLDNLPHEILHSEIVSIAEDPLAACPRRLAAKSGGDLPSMTDPKTGQEKTQGTFYPAHAPLGLYGHDSEYHWLRGQLEFTPYPPQESGEAESLGEPVAGVLSAQPQATEPEATEPQTAEVEDSRGPDGLWSLRYISDAGISDEYGGRLLLDPSDLKGYEPGDYVAVDGELASHAPHDSAPLDANLSSAGPAYKIVEIRRLDDANQLLQIGLRGRAKIHTQWQPLGKRLWRFVSHTFNFKL
ncbi:MAG: hemolysin D [Pirellulales bacterium]|nr:hemolysin D [Pirellulales bacterium]